MNTPPDQTIVDNPAPAGDPNRMGIELGKKPQSIDLNRFIFEQASDCILFLRCETGQVVDSNRAAQATYGYSWDELAALTIVDLCAPGSAQEFEAGLRKSNSGETCFHAIQRRKDATSFEVEVRASIVIFKDEQVYSTFIREVSSAQQIADQLRETEAGCRRLFEDSQLGIFRTSLAGKVLAGNPAAARMFGYASSEDMIAGVSDVAQDLYADPQDRLEVIRRLRETNTPQSIEVAFRRKDGTTFIGNLHFRAVMDDHGQVLFFEGIVEDITERRQAEVLMMESKERYRALFEDSPVALLELDLTGLFAFLDTLPTRGVVDLKEYLGAHPETMVACVRGILLTDANRAAIQMFGALRKEEVLGAPLVFDQSTFSAYRTSTLALACGESRFETESILLRMDGKPVDVILSWMVAGRNGNQPVKALVSILNVTQRKSAERALRESEERYRQLVELSPDAILIQSQGRYTFVNDAGCKLFGADCRDQILGRPVIELIHPDDQSIVRERIRLINENHIGVPPVEEKYLRLDGSAVDVEVLSTPFTYNDQPGGLVIARDITERKRAQAALRDSEERYRHLVEVAPDAILICEQEKITFVNPAGLRLLGATYRDQILGRQLYEIFQPTTSQDLKRRMEAVFFASAPVPMFEENVVRLDSVLVDVEVVITPIADHGDPSIQMMLHDTSRRKQIEKALRESEERFRTLFDESPVPIFEEDFSGVRMEIQHLCQGSLDCRGYFTAHPEDVPKCLRLTRILNVNQAAVVTYHAKSQEELAHNFSRIVGDANSVFHLETLLAISEGRTQFEIEIVNNTLTGEEIFVVLKWVVVSGCETNYERVLVSATDITARRRAEETLLQYRDHLEELVDERTSKLTQSEASLRKFAKEISDLYDNAPCGYHSLDRNGTFVRINDTELKWLGYSREEILGQKKMSDLLTTKDAVRFAQEFPQFIDQGFIQNIEAEMIRKDGSLFPVMISATALYDENGNFVMSRDTFVDNTEHKRAEAALRESKEAAESANRAKSAFLANMSHEIRTPMNAILGFTQLMLRDPNLPARQLQHLQTIHRSGEHLLGLINDILEMSKIEANRITLNPTTFDLPAMVHDLEAIFRLRIENQQLQFLVEVDPQLPQYVVSDEQKLRQVFTNLLGNAAKFTQQGGICWRIEVQKDDQESFHLVSEIEDTGPGIAPKEMTTLFTPFGQTSSGIKTGGGTGLGLVISRKIAQLMDGEITAQSELGKGSIFHLDVKIDPGKAGDVTNTPIHQTVRKLKAGQDPYRLLVVDDQEENRILLMELLGAVGFVVREATNGQEAVQCFQEWSPHLILMDMRMPDMDGYEATRKIRALENGHHTPIIAVTASAFSNDKKRILRSGFDGYVRKPYRESELFQSIQHCLGVEYEYALSEPEPVPSETEQFPTLPQVFLDLPSELSSQIRDAVISANLDQLLGLIDQVAEHSPQNAGQLRQMAENYQYDEILARIDGKNTI